MKTWTRYTWVTKLKTKVHKETPLVNEIVKMSKWCKSPVAIARTLGCTRQYVGRVLGMNKSQAHVYLNEESYKVLASN